MTAYPQFAHVESGSVSGSDPYVFTASGDGGVGESDVSIPADTDGKIRFTLGTFFGAVFFALNKTNSYRDLGAQDFGVGVGDGGDFEPRSGSDVLTPIGDDSLVGTAGFIVEIERAGVEIFINVYDGAAWHIVHAFDEQYTGELWPNWRTFDAGNVFAPIAEIGQTRTYWVPNTTQFVDSGNSWRTRAEPKTISQRMRFLAPFLGSGTLITNVAIDGQTTQEMLDDHSAVDAAYDAGYDYHVLGATEISNEIFLNSTPGLDAANLFGDYLAACLAVHASWMTAAQTTFPSQRGLGDGSTLTDFNLECDAADDALIADPGSFHVDALLDIDVLPLYADFAGIYTVAKFTASAAAYYEQPNSCLHQSGDDAGGYQQLTAEAWCAMLMTLPIPLSSPASAFNAAWARGANTVIQS